MKSQSATNTPSRPERELGQGGFPLPRTPTRTPPRERGLLSGPFRKALARATATGGRQRPKRGSARTQERPRPSVSGTWTDDPERSRSTAEDRVTHTRPRGGTRGASGATTSPTAGEAQPTPHHHPNEGGRQARDVSLTSRDQRQPLPHTPPGRGERGSRSGRIPHPCVPHTTRGGAEKRGARGQNEKSGPIRHECPSLAWRSLGPAQESTQPPHRSINGARGAGTRLAREGGRGRQRGQHNRGARFLPRRSLSHTPKKSAEPETTRGGTPDTQRHGATRKRNGSSRGALGACDGEHTGVEDPRRLTHRPRVLETGGGTTVEGSPGNSDVQEPAHGPKADDSSARESTESHSPSRGPSPSPSGDSRRATACQHIPADTKLPPRAKRCAAHRSGHTPPTTPALRRRVPATRTLRRLHSQQARSN